MSFSRILAITGRITSQFRRDHRTLGLIFIAPILVMSILGYVLRAQEDSIVSVAVVNEDRPPCRVEQRGSAYHREAQGG